ncbi:MAG: hypothetical protein JNK04_25270 [Myxococcales bacterium]|nr:hypothetical protein [Myxococcales bacterium]
MRTRTFCRPPVGRLLWTAVMAIALPSTFFVAGCGDDSPTGGSGGGDGGGISGGNGGEGNGNPTGGSGGDGGGGGGTVVPNDSCDNPGSISIGVGEQLEVQGTVAGANDDHDAFCDPDNNPEVPEVVYALTVTEGCNATFTLDGVAPGFDGLLSIRTDCLTDENQTCANASTGPSESATVTLSAGNYFVHVGDAGSGSTFTLGISCAAAGCGDFILDAGEECDFGIGAQGADDGCDETCQFEPNDPGNTVCADVTAGPAIVVDPGDVLFASGSTINGERAGVGSCQEPVNPPNLASRDNIVKVRPSAAGTLTLTLGEDQTGMPYCGDDTSVEPTFPYPPGCYDRAIHVRTACDLPASEVPGGCAELDATTGPWWGVETLNITVLPNVDYYVFVDGWLDLGPGSQDDVGIYDLKIEL